MVVWEIALASAYVLGLKRSYALALKAQRRLVSPRRPKLRLFLHRRTRSVFDVALKVHKNIQERDIKVGRNLGNRILQWVDRMRPSAQISGQQFPKLPTLSLPKINMPKKVFSTKVKTPRIIQASRKLWSNPFPAISMMMQQQRLAGRMTQSRDLFTRAPNVASLGFICRARGSEGVLRPDVMQYLRLKGQ